MKKSLLLILVILFTGRSFSQGVTLSKGVTIISPFLNLPNDTQKVEPIKIRLNFNPVNADTKKDTTDTPIKFILVALGLSNQPALISEAMTISAERWKFGKGVVDTFLYVKVSGLKATLQSDETGYIKIDKQKESDDVHIIKLSVNNEDKGGDTLFHNSNFVSASLIKTIAGTNIPSSELLDIFVRLNIGSQKKLFALFSADAGLGSINATDSTSKKQPFRLNEAMANFNYAFYRTHHVKRNFKCDSLFNAQFGGANNRGYLSAFLSADSLYKRCREVRDSLSSINAGFFDKLRRTAFAGAGLKIFYNEAYVGVHIGVLEINGPLFGSYFLCGYYLNTYRNGVSISDTANGKTNSEGLSFNYYRNNIYLEAGLNIFSNSRNQFSTFFNSIRFKFGLMLPMRSKYDAVSPRPSDIISRLVIEVPLGIRRF